LACALAACGGSDGRKTSPTSPAQARPADFPSPRSTELARLTKMGGDRPQLAPSVSVLSAGPNRFGFALFDAAGEQIQAVAAVYTASPEGTDVRGPYVARVESLAVDPRFASKTTQQDRDHAKTVQVAQVPFPQRGNYVTIAVARIGVRLVASRPAAVEVDGAGPVAIGAPAPRTHTPTVADVGGNISTIETRIPPDDMHRTDFADVVGRKPVVLTFATPQLCQSRVCAPVVDEMAQLQSEFGDRATFIHMEIYRNNRVEKGFRPQLAAWGLGTEPWVFTVDRSGRVAARLEGAASVSEIRAAIRKALR
jgi:hypothetical protein